MEQHVYVASSAEIALEILRSDEAGDFLRALFSDRDLQGQRVFVCYDAGGGVTLGNYVLC